MSDADDRPEQTFPRLTPEQADRVAAYGVEETIPAGTVLFRRGDRSVDFFLVRDGAIEIDDPDPDGTHHVVTVHTERQFTGELDLFNDRQTLLGGHALRDSRVVRIRRVDFRRLVQAEPDVAETVMRAFILRRVGLLRFQHGGLVLIGPAHSADTLRIEQFLTRNAYPHRTLDTERDPDAAGFLDCFSLRSDALPVVIAPGNAVLRNPSLPELADAIGLTETIDDAVVFDLVVVGAGPAGLAAAVYGASEGLHTLVVEAFSPGGQAGTSSKIENYLGFPTGISGGALAGRAQVQAQKFGARLAVSRAATGLRAGDDAAPFVVAIDGELERRGRAVVVATGARYRRLGVEGEDRYEGQGIYYAATAMEADLCRDAEVVVVGGGNSAGQAAVFLAGRTRHVHVLVRAEGLAATMSDYLVQRIQRSSRITLHVRTEVVGLHGERGLEGVTWRSRTDGTATTRAVSGLFAMIGAEPNTGFVAGVLALDEQGFVCTGSRAGAGADSPYQTSWPGVFAVGDVRSGSVKRVASGVGEGSVVVHAVHRWLAGPHG